jgi:hypothetical protein
MALIAIVSILAWSGLVALFSTCDWDWEPGWQLGAEFDNRTQFELCLYETEVAEEAAVCDMAVVPNTVTEWELDCLYSERKTIILTLRDGGVRIYRADGTCGEWGSTEMEFVIELVGSELILTDPFGDIARTPEP